MTIAIVKCTFAYSLLLFVALSRPGSTRAGITNDKKLPHENPFDYRSANTTISAASTRHRRAVSCYAPPKPVNGEVRLNGNSCGSTGCRIAEGTAVSLGQSLVYSCNPGYRLDGSSNTLFCVENGKWHMNSPRCIEIKCDPLSSVSRIATCHRFGKLVNCDFPALPHTLAAVICRPGYQRASGSLSLDTLELACSEDGKWSPADILRCVPTCGRAANIQTPLIVNGTTAKVSEFPWHATLYRLEITPRKTEKKFICGATIIQPNLLLTAAHCIYDESTESIVNPDKLFVLTGNIFRDFEYPGHNKKVVRSGEVKTVYMPNGYFGLQGNYLSDIALLQLKTPFELSGTLILACLPEGSRILEAGSYGKIAGFGKTAKSSSSGILQSISIPYVGYTICSGSTTGNRNRILIQPDKFCAGYANGSAVCEGDSGGGIAFEENGRWHVMGIVSLGLGVNTDNGERTCDSFSYTLFTNVDSHIKWIKGVISSIQYHSQPSPSTTRTQSALATPMTTVTTTTTSSPPNVVSISGEFELCIAPSQPPNGKWKLHRSLCNGLDGPDLECEVPSGAELPLGSELVYVCDPGYEHSGETVLCLDEGSWSSSPVCVSE